MNLTLRNEKLTDGSMVFNFDLVDDDGNSVRFRLTSEYDAIPFAAKLSKAIEVHTTSCVEVIDGQTADPCLNPREFSDYGRG